MWIVGYCKDEDCPWVVARVHENRFTSLRVTEQMVEHSSETGHSCREEPYYPNHTRAST